MIAAPVILASTPSLGVAEGRCRAGETGPAVIVTALGLKDQRGRLKVEVYPATEADFLADDNILLSAGKTFRRVEVDLSARAPAELCVRLPGPGRYSMAVTHDRNGDHKFQPVSDGVGFPGDPKIGWSKPKAAAAEFVAGPGLIHLYVTINYWSGLAAMAPLKREPR